jgi:phosphonopyruvate decarboxylase
MIPAAYFADALRARSYQFFTGVPCSFLGGVINELGSRYTPAADEGSALAMAAAAALAGKPAAVLLQNSGLGNLVNPLTSLAIPYQIPVLLVVSMRGWPDPATDEVQHGIMGPATPRILDACTVAYQVLDPDPARLDRTLADLAPALGAGPAALLVPRGCIEGAATCAAGPPSWTAADAVGVIAEHIDRYVVFATTGYISRQLFSARDLPTNFYMQGAMGHAMAMGTAAAAVAPDRQVLVLDGDGAAIMHMGSMATIGGMGPANLVHVIIDNNAYESTGGQPSVAGGIDWERLGTAMGYRTSQRCRSAAETELAMGGVADRRGPHLIVVSVGVSTEQAPPRATGTLSAPQISDRLRHSFGQPGQQAAPAGEPRGVRA